MSDARARAEALFGRLPASGCWLDLPSPETAEIAALAGADFGVVDLEHGAASIETAGRMLGALRAAGAAAVARPPELSEAWVKRLCDAGADMLIAPMVESAAQAAEVAAWMRYPPEGRRGLAASVIRASGWGLAARDYHARWNARCLLAVQIEGPKALARAGEIAAVEGVHMLFFGPADFSSFAGFHEGPADGRAFDAFREMAAAAHAAGRLAGSVAFPAADGATLVRAGCDFVAAASDVAALAAGIAATVAAARG